MPRLPEAPEPVQAISACDAHILFRDRAAEYHKPLLKAVERLALSILNCDELETTDALLSLFKLAQEAVQ